MLKAWKYLNHRQTAGLGMFRLVTLTNEKKETEAEAAAQGCHCPVTVLAVRLAKIPHPTSPYGNSSEDSSSCFWNYPLTKTDFSYSHPFPQDSIPPRLALSFYFVLALS